MTRAEHPCEHFTAWAYESDGETFWSWSCDCGRDGTAARKRTILGVIGHAAEAHHE